MSEATEVLKMLNIFEADVLISDISRLKSLIDIAVEEKHKNHNTVVKSTLSAMNGDDPVRAFKRLEKQLSQHTEIKPQWSKHLAIMLRNIRQGTYDNLGRVLLDGDNSVLQEIFKAFKQHVKGSVK